jgi:hypothetical protein
METHAAVNLKGVIPILRMFDVAKRTSSILTT